MKEPAKNRPMCRHCFAYVQWQKTIDEDRVCLNPDGTPHKCAGYLNEVHQKNRGPVYARRPESPTLPPPVHAQQEVSVVRPEFTLDAAMLKRAEASGRKRNKTHVDRGAAITCVMPEGREHSNIIGAKSELAVSEWLGIPWDGEFFTYREWLKWRKNPECHDVGPFEVRSTSMHSGRVLLYEKDRDDDPFISVLNRFDPMFTFAGWVYGRDGKKREFWQQPSWLKNTFGMPPHLLRPFDDEFYAILAAWRAAQAAKAK